ncbi:nuclear transport factor 2 family protein [Marinicaulis aureus]|uniref:Nuclear transport factor 2 family protein n=1 Tax=Hyphococcus aureus TaxID=2666033 RepID=A0ABW1L104_9PROT
MKKLIAALFIAILAVVPAAAKKASYADDRAAIEDLMARYLFAMDWNDFDAYVAMFTEDGELEYARGSATGRENIGATVKAFKESIGKIYTDQNGDPAALRHVIAHKVIRVEGDRAWATSFWYEMANDGPEGAPKIGTFGHYEASFNASMASGFSRAAPSATSFSTAASQARSIRCAPWMRRRMRR